MQNTYSKVFRLNKLQGINILPLCSSQTFRAIGRIKFSRCVVILRFISSVQEFHECRSYIHVCGDCGAGKKCAGTTSKMPVKQSNKLFQFTFHIVLHCHTPQVLGKVQTMDPRLIDALYGPGPRTRSIKILIRATDPLSYYP